MSQKSKKVRYPQESRGRCDRGGDGLSEWADEGKPMDEGPVGETDSDRYRGERMTVRDERAARRNQGGTAGSFPVPMKESRRDFLFFRLTYLYFRSERKEYAMKKNVKTAILLVLVCLLAILPVLTGCDGGKDDGKLRVCIGQFGEHESLDNCRLGFIEGLKQEGFIDGENIVIDYKNASFDGAVCTSINQAFVSDKADLICAIATPIAQAAASCAEEDGIPVVFTAVTDPTGSNLVTGEVTGTSDMLPVEAQLQLIRGLMPEAKKIGILYTTSESNSLYAISVYKDLAAKYGFEIVERGITSASDLPVAMNAIIDEVDCFSNLTDNTVVGCLTQMLDIAAEHGNKPIFGSEVEQVKKGCVAAEGLEYYELGIQTGKIAARILKGEKASAIKFETVTEHFLYVNRDALAKSGLTLTAEQEARATDALTYGK